jgi:transcriptional regulator with XRE-family HTH domain
MNDALLDQLLEDAHSAAVSAASESSTSPKQAVRKVNYSHDGMINLILSNRGISQNELARHFGYSASWISQVMSSDAFQARLAERAAEIEDPTLRASAEEQIKGIHARSMEILREKLAGNPADIPDQLVMRSFEISSRALGFGARDNSPPAPPVSVHLHLEEMKENLVGLLRRERKLISVDEPGSAADQLTREQG